MQSDQAVSHKSGGFTLLEVMLALTVLSIIAGLSWQGLANLLKTQFHVQEHIQRHKTRDLAVMQWRLDWQALWTDDVGLTLPITQWDGNSLILLRRAPITTQSFDEGLVVVAWTVREGQWWRWASLPFNKQSDGLSAWQNAVLWTQQGQSQAQAQALLPTQSWQILYRQGSVWVNPGSSPTPNLDNNSQTSQSPSPSFFRLAPSAVRLKLVITDTQALTVDVASLPPSQERP